MIRSAQTKIRTWRYKPRDNECIKAMNIKGLRTSRFLLICMLFTVHLNAQTLDLSQAKIVCFEKNNALISKAIAVLSEEITKRSGVKLPLSRHWGAAEEAKIVVALNGQLTQIPKRHQELVASMASIGSEGYKVVVDSVTHTVLVVGFDARGVLYGVGKLLRKMEIDGKGIRVPLTLNVASSPKYPIRGHQLGYRPKTNAYDAFTIGRFDQYIRDLAIFGANSIEIVPPRTDDDFSSVHMKIPAIEMIREQSRIADSYGMDVWMWYPNMGTDYVHPDSVQVEINERHKVFKSLPRLDALFVPGGDPGDLDPDTLFAWLEKEAVILRTYHPRAKIWVSPQVFRPNDVWYDAFYRHVGKSYDWFGGLVFGPWIKTPLETIRERVGPEIPIRRYPDITHSLSSQYPVPKWDLAYAITLGRECINPRPNDEKMIHNALDELAQGSISYSEGTNDDVNKFVWSDQDWDPSTPVMETLRDYARFFMGYDFTESVAQGLMALEHNLQGSLLTNENTERTLIQWQKMASQAPVQVLNNFRFQMGLLRAYFDAYQYRRLVYETALERRAREHLENAARIGSRQSVMEATKTLRLAKEKPVQTFWKEKILELGDDLFESIGAQLTVGRHAAAEGRGNFIDNIDLPLNDAPWIIHELEAIETMSDEKIRLKAIDRILKRTDPGPGGFYDNFGSPRSWKRIVVDRSQGEDPGNLSSPRVSFGVGILGEEWVHEITAKGFEGQAVPLAWMKQITTLYDQPLQIRYDDLNPKNSYSIRVAYTGRFRSKMQLTADNLVIHDFMETGRQPIYEFAIPQAATEDGTVQFEFSCGEGERGAQVSEVWILNTTLKNER